MRMQQSEAAAISITASARWMTCVDNDVDSRGFQAEVLW
jgi:hypothetical protein